MTGLAEHLLRPWKQPTQNTYVLVNASIVDSLNGAIAENMAVRLSGGTIEAVTPEAVIKKDDIVIDLKGKYVCPGLIDAHVHVTAVPGEVNLGDLYNLDEQRSSIRQPYVCQQMLRRGFTSVRDCGGASLALKQAISEGVIQGPRL